MAMDHYLQMPFLGEMHIYLPAILSHVFSPTMAMSAPHAGSGLTL